MKNLTGRYSVTAEDVQKIRPDLVEDANRQSLG